MLCITGGLAVHADAQLYGKVASLAFAGWMYFGLMRLGRALEKAVRAG